MQDNFEWPQEWSSYTDLTVILNKFFSIMVKISKKLIYKRKKILSVTLKVKLGCIREILMTKKCKWFFTLLSYIIRKTLNSQKRIEKEITLLKLRAIDPKRIVAIIKPNPDLLLASKENVKIFLLALITRSNAKM